MIAHGNADCDSLAETMKTVEEVLEGVTAGGKWDTGSSGYDMCEPSGECLLDENAQFGRLADAAYAARACSTWPELVRALEGLTKFSVELCEDTGISANYPSIQAARAALEAALKD